MGHRKFEELEKQMGPERLAKAKAKAKEMMAEMLLAEIRKEAGFTQEDLAATLGVKQPAPESGNAPISEVEVNRQNNLSFGGSLVQ